MRMFKRVGQGSNISLLSSHSPIYCCQADGMIGLGCGARSYADILHYSNEYAVGAKGIRGILQAYIQTPDGQFDFASYGFKLNEEEQRRRFILLSLLSDEGLNIASYQQRFGNDLYGDFLELLELFNLDLAIKDEDFLRLNDFGIERSDTIGAWLFSANVLELMDGYELK